MVPTHPSFRSVSALKNHEGVRGRRRSKTRPMRSIEIWISIYVRHAKSDRPGCRSWKLSLGDLGDAPEGVACYLATHLIVGRGGVTSRPFLFQLRRAHSLGRVTFAIIIRSLELLCVMLFHDTQPPPPPPRHSLLRWARTASFPSPFLSEVQSHSLTQAA